MGVRDRPDSQMIKLLFIGLGGFVGAVARFGLTGAMHQMLGRAFPVGTLAVNVLGCLVFGSLMGLIETRDMWGPSTRQFLLVGILGSFTTFSTFGFETFVLLDEGRVGIAGLNVGLNLVLGLVGIFLGRFLFRLLV